MDFPVWLGTTCPCARCELDGGAVSCRFRGRSFGLARCTSCASHDARPAPPMTPSDIGLISVGRPLDAAGVGCAGCCGACGCGPYRYASPRRRSGITIAQLKSLPFAVVNNYELAVLPMFVLMGICARHLVSQRSCSRPCRIGSGACAAGSIRQPCLARPYSRRSPARPSSMLSYSRRVAYPEMVRHGYDRSFSIGCIAATGGLPP